MQKTHQLSYAMGGILGSLIPAYFVSLFLSEFKPSEALKIDGILTASRLGLLAISKLPKIKKIPIINKSHQLFLPEIYGGIAGVSTIASYYNFEDYNQTRQYVKEGNLEKNIESSEDNEKDLSQHI